MPHHLHIIYKSTCPFCQMALELIDTLPQDVHVTMTRVDNDPHWRSTHHIQTVPHIRIDGKVVGGWTELQARHRNGTLFDY